MSLTGTVLLAPTIALLRMANLGIDPWNGFVLGAARLFGANYLTLYPIMIGILLILVFFLSKHLIGIATYRLSYGRLHGFLAKNYCC